MRKRRRTAIPTKTIAQLMTSGTNSSATIYLLPVPNPSTIKQCGYTSTWPMIEQQVPIIPTSPPPIYPYRGTTDSPFPTGQFISREMDGALLLMSEYGRDSGYGRRTRRIGYWAHLPTGNSSDMFQYIWYATSFSGHTYRRWDNGLRRIS